MLRKIAVRQTEVFDGRGFSCGFGAMLSFGSRYVRLHLCLEDCQVRVGSYFKRIGQTKKQKLHQ